MVKPSLALVALLTVVCGCGSADKAGPGGASATTVAHAHHQPAVMQFAGNHVPEEPWWQVEPANPIVQEPPPEPPTLPSEETFDVSSDLLFAESSSELGAAANSQLRHVADILTEDRSAIVEIIGHTDNTPGPTPDYNDTLSHARSEAVRNWLVTSGVEISRTTTDGRAESEPVATNDTDAGRAANRRVTITIRRDQ